MNATMPTRLDDITRWGLLKAAIAPKHFREFMRPRWTPGMFEDFYGEDARALPPGAMDIPNRALLTVMPTSVYRMPMFNEFATALAGFNEVIRWTLHHSRVYLAAGVLQLTFFDQTAGQAGNRGASNMDASGQLPGDQMFVIASPRVIPIPAGADMLVIAAAGAVAFPEWAEVLQGIATQAGGAWGELNISQKVYLSAPLLMLSAGCGVGTIHNNSGAVAANTTASSISNGTPDNKAVYQLNPPLGLLPGRTFNFTCNWGALVTVTTVGILKVALDGWLLRSVQ